MVDLLEMAIAGGFSEQTSNIAYMSGGDFVLWVCPSEEAE